MPELVHPFSRRVARAAAPYAERNEKPPGRIDAVLLAVLARLRRPFALGLQRGRRMADYVERIQREVDALSDADLRQAAQDLRPGLRREGFVPDLVARSFALVRAAAGRTVGMRHFPVQLIGGHAMLEGMLAEMETGEGKTLTATLPAATAALAGMHVHVITVNDYLAERDAAAMRAVYEALGLSVGVVKSGEEPAQRRAAYAADISYCTNKDIGFDYLRDSLALETRKGRGRLLLEKLLQRSERLDTLLLRGLHFAIIDEADSVLIDEARTPLIISGGQGGEAAAGLFGTALEIARQLESGSDFLISRRERTVTLTDHGRSRLKELAQSLPQEWRSARGREELAQQGLSALHLFEPDVHYLVREGKVLIIDEYTGRVMPDRSWERGLQQLIELKEGCEATGMRTTLARVTYQRLFRRYLRLAGMTGTASEVAPELEAVYGLKVLRIPTNRPVMRRNHGVRLYATRERKWQAVADTVARITRAGRPVLIGTRSVAASEELGALFAASGVDHVLLNARQDQEEAEIIARAGEAHQVTIATNMAGRGTDIRLGPAVADQGGLHVILTEFHESKRIDRQLFGRSGRQGDAGSYEAITSLEDDIFRRHARSTAAALSARYGRQSQPLPAWAVFSLQAVAQHSAESANSHMRRATMEQDKRLDSALAFAGKAE